MATKQRDPNIDGWISDPEAQENFNVNRLSSRNFLNISKPSSIVCTYCSEPGHFSASCYFKNSWVPKGKFKWVPRSTATQSNTRGPKFVWVPASSK